MFFGILLCFVLAVPSWFLGKMVPVIGGPVIAIILGMLISSFWKNKTKFNAGIKFTSKKILQWAVILLGFGLNLGVVLKTGIQSLPIICSTIATSLVIAFILCKVLKIPAKIATLVGVGSSICGGSAIAATAPVIDADDEDVAQSISVVFLFNVLAAIIFPVFGRVIGFSTVSGEPFGIFAGTAVNDTSSVTAAASTWDSLWNLGTQTLDKAVTVKLTRTLAIIPITLALAVFNAKKAGKSDGSSVFSFRKVFPMFILYFVLASLITTLVTLFVPAGDLLDLFKKIFSFLKNVSKFFIIMAMGAIGLNTDVVKLVRTGGKPLLLGFCCWTGISAVSLLMQHILGIW